jgi:hypothetical protein
MFSDPYGLLKVHGESMFCYFFNAKGAKFAKKKEIFACLAGFAVRSLNLRKPYSDPFFSSLGS